jgi:hypothetical protein
VVTSVSVVERVRVKDGVVVVAVDEISTSVETTVYSVVAGSAVDDISVVVVVVKTSVDTVVVVEVVSVREDVR